MIAMYVHDIVACRALERLRKSVGPAFFVCWRGNYPGSPPWAEQSRKCAKYIGELMALYLNLAMPSASTISLTLFCVSD